MYWCLQYHLLRVEVCKDLAITLIHYLQDSYFNIRNYCFFTKETTCDTEIKLSSNIKYSLWHVIRCIYYLPQSMKFIFYSKLNQFPHLSYTILVISQCKPATLYAHIWALYAIFGCCCQKLKIYPSWYSNRTSWCSLQQGTRNGVQQNHWILFKSQFLAIIKQLTVKTKQCYWSKNVWQTLSAIHLPAVMTHPQTRSAWANQMSVTPGWK